MSFAFYGEVLFCNSPKEYPEKAVTTPDAPVKSTGVPIDVYPVSSVKKLAHVEKHVRSDSFHRRPMIPGIPQ